VGYSDYTIHIDKHRKKSFMKNDIEKARELEEIWYLHCWFLEQLATVDRTEYKRNNYQHRKKKV